MFDFLKKKREEADTPQKLTYGEYRGTPQEEEVSLDGVPLDRELFAKMVQKYAPMTGVDVDEEMLELLTDYYEMVVRSNANVNLTAITEASEFAIKHVIDSLMLAQFIAPSRKKQLLDVGTGAGLPTIPLAITHPYNLFVVIEAQNKRYEFVKFACKGLNVSNVAINRYRAEEAAHRALYREQFDFATARAVAPLNVLTEYCMGMVKMGGLFLAMKGSNYQEELDGAENAIFQMGGRFEEVRTYTLPSGEERAIIVIKKVVPCRRDVPRRTAAIKKNPF